VNRGLPPDWLFVRSGRCEGVAREYLPGPEIDHRPFRPRPLRPRGPQKVRGVGAGATVKQSQVVCGNDGPAANATRGTYNLVMVVAAVVSAIVGMVALIPR